MTAVLGRLELPSGAPVGAGWPVTATLQAASPWLADRSAEVVLAVRTVTAADGSWTLQLVPTTALEDPGATYAVDEGGLATWIVGPVPDSEAPLRLRDLLAGDPATTPPGPALVSADLGNALQLRSNGLFVPPGGGAGAAPVLYRPSAPAATWIVAHGLGYRPAVAVTDLDGDQVLPGVSTDLQVVTITFAAPFDGYATLR